VIRRIAGVLVRPRATLSELAARPAWVATWAFILITWACCGGWLLASDIGQQALVDERVRVVEAFGGTVSDAEYQALLRRPPMWVYVTSGSRALLLPATTLAVAVALWLVARAEGAAATLTQALSLVVHASVVLLLGQIIATPLHYGRESLTSPLNLSAVLPFMEEGTFRARLFGTIDLFAVWWAVLLAMSLSILTGRRTGRYLIAIAVVFLGFGGAVAAMIAASGGS
jgi:Yip1-like protein